MNRFSCYKLISSHPKYSGEEVENKLKQQGIICGGAVYRGACHVQPVFNKVAIDTSLISTDQFSNKHFCLPVHSGISLESAEKIISAVTNL
jgi:dTDP-4-amino-4,6-dideoxygalactose transaminase